MFVDQSGAHSYLVNGAGWLMYGFLHAKLEVCIGWLAALCNLKMCGSHLLLVAIDTKVLSSVR